MASITHPLYFPTHSLAHLPILRQSHHQFQFSTRVHIFTTQFARINVISDTVPERYMAHLLADNVFRIAPTSLRQNMSYEIDISNHLSFLIPHAIPTPFPIVPLPTVPFDSPLPPPPLTSLHPSPFSSAPHLPSTELELIHLTRQRPAPTFRCVYIDCLNGFGYGTSHKVIYYFKYMKWRLDNK